MDWKKYFWAWIRYGFSWLVMIFGGFGGALILVIGLFGLMSGEVLALAFCTVGVVLIVLALASVRMMVYSAFEIAQSERADHWIIK